MKIVSQRNPMKTRVLALLRAGKITVPQAARKAQVPVSAIVGWCRLHHVALPAEYAGHTHRPKPEVPGEASAMWDRLGGA